MSDHAYYNGVITPYDSACIPLSDRSIFFGEGVYDVMIGGNEKIYQFERHISRLCDNAKRIGLTLKSEKSDILQNAMELIKISGYKNFILYIQLSGNGKRRSHITSDTDTNLLMTVTEYTPPASPEYISAVSTKDMRYGYCDIKTTNLLPNILSLRCAESMGADIAIFLNDGIVSECSHANIAILKDGKIKTPQLSNSLLPGITRENLMKVCKKIGMTVSEEDVTYTELIDSDCVIISSTTHFLRICTKIDGVKLSEAGRDTVNMIFDYLKNDFSVCTDLRRNSRDN